MAMRQDVKISTQLNALIEGYASTAAGKVLYPHRITELSLAPLTMNAEARS